MPNYGGGNEDNGNLLQKVPHALLHSVLLTLQQATTDPSICWRLLDNSGQVWVSLLWGHCSFLLDPGAHKFLFGSISSFFLRGHKQNFVFTRTQEKGAVTPQETDPDLPMSVQESLVEA